MRNGCTTRSPMPDTEYCNGSSSTGKRTDRWWAEIDSSVVGERLCGPGCLLGQARGRPTLESVPDRPGGRDTWPDTGIPSDGGRARRTGPNPNLPEWADRLVRVATAGPEPSARPVHSRSVRPKPTAVSDAVF